VGGAHTFTIAIPVRVAMVRSSPMNVHPFHPRQPLRSPRRPGLRRRFAFLPALLGLGLIAGAHAASLGDFEQAVDVGKVARPGSSAFDSAQGQYRITGSGHNIWGKEDAFHFLHKNLSGDLAFTMDVAWEGAGQEAHRKVGAMVRQGLGADAPYVDIAVHGDGLIELQYRKEKGGETVGVRTPIKAPARVKLERDGDVFTASVAKAGGPYQPIGAISLALPDPVQVGLAVCAHHPKNSETALISHVALTNRIAQPGEKRVRETSLEVLTYGSGERRLVYRERSSFEAPNWSRDGRTLYINRAGGIYTIPVAGGELTRLNTGALDKCNNDHGLSFDGQWLAISSGGGKEGSRIYVLPATGGEPRLVTPLGPSYWHGWSPDGQMLTYCAKRGDNYDIYTIPTAGGEERRLTTAEGLDDGSEYSADGSKIYFNSERTGVMQIWRMNPDGTQQEPVTNDPRFADWFAHPSPDGQLLVFLSFEPSVKGHPANQNVTLRLMPLAGGKPKIIATLFGGQGTINVPSWSPDSKQIAFVSYRHVLP
jgi:TolB protein